MRSTSLQRLLEAARALPGDRDPVECRAPAPSSAPAATRAPRDPAALRAEVGAFLRDLAARTEPALHDALARAQNAWDQADAVSVVDDEMTARATTLKADWWTLAASGQPGARAAAVEGLLAIEAGLGLVALVERRLATLIRLHTAGGGDLLPGGRPFLDVAAALHEAARGWA
jgi:hypothetical protein